MDDDKNDKKDKEKNKGLNGSGSGAGWGDRGDREAETGIDTNIVHFPTLADRDRIRKEKTAQEEAWRAEYKAKQKILQKADNPPFLNMGNIPVFIRILLPALILIHAAQVFGISDARRMEVILNFGFVPTYYYSHFGWQAFTGPFTYLFLHGDWMHLIFNSIMLIAMGTFFARNMGNRMAWIFFFACGIGGAALFGLVHFDERMPLIGASGAISGYFAVFLVLMYKRGGFQQFSLVRKYGLMGVIGFWLGLMFVIAILMGGQSWEAHTGGFMTGLLLLSWLIRKDLKFWRL